MNNICWTCGGYPDSHPSGTPCICGGTGKHDDEVTNLRLALSEKTKELELLDKAIKLLESGHKLANIEIDRQKRTIEDLESELSELYLLPRGLHDD